MKLFIITAILFVTLVACQESSVIQELEPRGTRITGGYTASTGLIKCYVALLIEDENSGMKTCGGCLIPKVSGGTGDRILSSASCLFSAANGKAVSIKFYTGLAGPAGTAQSMRIVDVFKNVAFNPANNVSGADIAQIILEKSFTLSSSFQPAVPATEDKADAYSGEDLVVCGHGNIDNNRTKPGSKGLQCTTLRVVPVAECATALQKGAVLPKGIICTMNNDARNVCGGDQGAPVFSNKTGSLMLVGLVSFFPNSRGNARCEDGHYAAITQVGYHTKFVDDPKYIQPEALLPPPKVPAVPATGK